MSNKKFKSLTHTNVDRMYTDRLLEKGALLKYRFSSCGIADYGLDYTDNEWHYGIISETLWYINMSITKLYPDSECVCYDLNVHNMTLGTKEMINIELYEIKLLVSE